MWRSSPVHACSNGYLLRALQLHPNTTLPAWNLSSACCYLCCFAFTRPIVHCGGDGLSSTQVTRMVVFFLWFCLYVPCTGYTVFICRERINVVKSEINFIFFCKNEEVPERTAITCPRLTSILFHSSPAQAVCATSLGRADFKVQVILKTVDFWSRQLQGRGVQPAVLLLTRTNVKAVLQHLQCHKAVIRDRRLKPTGIGGFLVPCSEGWPGRVKFISVQKARILSERYWIPVPRVSAALQQCSGSWPALCTLGIAPKGAERQEAGGFITSFLLCAMATLFCSCAMRIAEVLHFFFYILFQVRFFVFLSIHLGVRKFSLQGVTLRSALDVQQNQMASVTEGMPYFLKTNSFCDENTPLFSQHGHPRRHTNGDPETKTQSMESKTIRAGASCLVSWVCLTHQKEAKQQGQKCRRISGAW